MVTNRHKEDIARLKEKFTNEGYKCFENWKQFRPQTDSVSQIDLVCWDKNGRVVGIETEATSLNSIQSKLNKIDLSNLKRAYGDKARVCQKTPEMPLESCPDFKTNKNKCYPRSTAAGQSIRRGRLRW